MNDSSITIQRAPTAVPSERSSASSQAAEQLTGRHFAVGMLYSSSLAGPMPKHENNTHAPPIVPLRQPGLARFVRLPV
jgi:hypothetical protein